MPKYGLLGAAFAVIITSTVLAAGEVVLLWYVLSNVNREARSRRLTLARRFEVSAAIQEFCNKGRKS